MKHLKFNESRKKTPQLWFLAQEQVSRQCFSFPSSHQQKHVIRWLAISAQTSNNYQSKRIEQSNKLKWKTHTRTQTLICHYSEWHFRMGRVTILLMHPDGMMMMTMIIVAGHLWYRSKYGANHYLIICIWWQSNWNNFSIEMERKKLSHVQTNEYELPRQTIHTKKYTKKKKTIKLRGRKREREIDGCRRRREIRNGRVVHVAFATARTFNTHAIHNSLSIICFT